MSDELINDLKAARARDNAPRLDVTPILTRHVPVGSPWDASRGRLEAIGCICRPRPASQQAPGGAQVFDCTASLRPWYALGFGDELQLMVDIVGNKVATLRAELIYRSL